MKTLEQQILDKCIHFNGVQNSRCEKGVCYKELTAGSYTLPCYRNYPGVIPSAECEHRQFPTEEEAILIAEEKRKSVERYAAVFAAIQPLRKDLRGKGVDWRGMIDCPVCGAEQALALSYAKYNGHMSGRCKTEGCVSWIE